jgi:hypothetical protein
MGDRLFGSFVRTSVGGADGTAAGATEGVEDEFLRQVKALSASFFAFCASWAAKMKFWLAAVHLPFFALNPSDAHSFFRCARALASALDALCDCCSAASCAFTSPDLLAASLAALDASSCALLACFSASTNDSFAALHTSASGVVMAHATCRAARALAIAAEAFFD